MDDWWMLVEVAVALIIAYAVVKIAWHDGFNKGRDSMLRDVIGDLQIDRKGEGKE